MNVQPSVLISASAYSPAMKSGPAGFSISELRHCATRLWEFSVFIGSTWYLSVSNVLYFSKMFLTVDVYAELDAPCRSPRLMVFVVRPSSPPSMNAFAKAMFDSCGSPTAT